MPGGYPDAYGLGGLSHPSHRWDTTALWSAPVKALRACLARTKENGRPGWGRPCKEPTCQIQELRSSLSYGPPNGWHNVLLKHPGSVPAGAGGLGAGLGEFKPFAWQ